MRLFEISDNIKPAKVSWRNDNGVAFNESVTAALRLITEDDDIALDNPERAGYVMITGISLQHNGKPDAGRASDVLRAITMWADYNNIHLILVPSASGRLDNEMLSAWYERNKFYKELDGSMIRAPQ
jgi:hypothetical protein